MTVFSKGMSLLVRFKLQNTVQLRECQEKKKKLDQKITDVKADIELNGTCQACISDTSINTGLKEQKARFQANLGAVERKLDSVVSKIKILLKRQSNCAKAMSRLFTQTMSFLPINDGPSEGTFPRSDQNVEGGDSDDDDDLYS